MPSPLPLTSKRCTGRSSFIRKTEIVSASCGALQTPAEFQLRTVTYGLASAPFLALRVIAQLANDEEARFPDAATVLRQHMYVDDVLSGADTVQLAKRKATQIDQLLRASGFTLQKWAANAAEAISDLAAPLDSAPTRELDTQAVSRTLGLLWHHETDMKLRLLIPGAKRFIDISMDKKGHLITSCAALRSSRMDSSSHHHRQNLDPTTVASWSGMG